MLVRNRRHTTGDIESSDDTLDTSGEEDNKDVSTFRGILSTVRFVYKGTTRRDVEPKSLGVQSYNASKLFVIPVWSNEN